MTTRHYCPTCGGGLVSEPIGAPLRCKSMSLTWFKDLPLLKLPDEPTEVVLTRDTRFDGDDLSRFVERGGGVKNSGYRVFVDGAVSFETLNMLAPAQVIARAPGSVTLTNVGAPMTVAPGVRITGADPDLLNGGSGPVLLVARAWHVEDRVRVVRGEHEGRTGTVSALSSSPYAKYLKIELGYVQVSLDGEPGRADGTGSRGGHPVVASDDLEPYDGPAGVATSKEPR